jgi:hypothetical protein
LTHRKSMNTLIVLASLVCTCHADGLFEASLRGYKPTDVDGRQLLSNCVRNLDCTVNAWCNDPAYDSWCPQQGSTCPSPMCIVTSASFTSKTTTVPTTKTTTGALPTSVQSTSAKTTAKTTISTSTTKAVATTTSKAIATSISTTASSSPQATTTPQGSGGTVGVYQNGNPQPLKNMTDVVIDSATLACTDPKWKPDSTGLWTFQQIAEAFLIYGVAKFYKPTTVQDLLPQCVAALYIVSGECQETSATLGKGCSAGATGPSGVFQLDFLRTATVGNKVNPQIASDGNMMNLCISGFGAGYLTATPYVDSTHVATLEGDSFYTCTQAPSTVNAYGCPDPQSTAGSVYPNFIGTFCHKGFLSRWSACPGGSTAGCCGIWNGGANSYQIPFPSYYYQKAQAHFDSGANFTSICQRAISVTGR